MPNLVDYEAACASFSWSAIREDLSGLPAGGGINMAYEAVDRHARGPRADHTALRWIDKDGGSHDYSYSSLSALSSRFANLLGHLGIKKGDTVCVLAGRIPELYITALGALKHGAVFCPLFSVFGPEPIRTRLALGRARLLVTTASLYANKIAPLRCDLPELDHVLLVDGPADSTETAQTVGFHRLLEEASDEYAIAPTDPEDMALLHFTSGTTGQPKGVVHVHDAVVAHYATARFALDLCASDMFWCTADPGWVTGTSYGIVAPLVIGATLLVDSGEYSPDRWCRILSQQRVTVWYTSPTAIRIMMKSGPQVAEQYGYPALRLIASVGEPLNREAVCWGQKIFGQAVHDNWWQTETGSIMIANYLAMPVKPGSMGRPLPGITAAVVRRIGGTGVAIIDQPGTRGELALQTGWPSMFRNYLGEPERYRQCFRAGWYLTGDIVSRDEDGYFWFMGREDDMIKTSGHLVGPAEVERVMLAHPAVAEVAVIGKPDTVAMEIVKAFVELRPGFTADEPLRRELLAHARKNLGAAIAPKEIEFRSELPKNQSGKILRRILKAQEANLPAGDM